MEINQKPSYEISVTDLVHFCHQEGHIDFRFKKTSSSKEGQEIHQKIQEEKEAPFITEKHLELIHEEDHFSLKIRGRADSANLECNPIEIEEIKSTSLPIHEIPESKIKEHFLQAQLYAAMALRDTTFVGAYVTVNYVQIAGYKQHPLRKYFDRIELEEILLTSIQKYCQWQQERHEWLTQRNLSLKNMTFPYSHFREGQRNLSIYCYRNIQANKRLYTQAPTGTGKTIGMIFPALKAMGENIIDQIFFATAKTSGKNVVEETITTCQKQSSIKTVFLTAKEKTCFQEEVLCHPDKCPYAVDYYQKAPLALAETWGTTLLNKEAIEEIAKKYTICPFEFSLLVARYADLIIADYNYVFDPYARLSFLNTTKEKRHLLIDEAHNLPDRARDMHSEELSLSQFDAAYAELSDFSPHHDLLDQLKKTKETIQKTINRQLKNLKDTYTVVLQEIPRGFITSIKKLNQQTENFLQEKEEDFIAFQLQSLYFSIIRFLNAIQIFDQRFRLILSKGKWARIKIWCLDPSSEIKAHLDNFHSSVVFSATLTPSSFYQNMIEGNIEASSHQLPSPFSPSLQKNIIYPTIRTLYQVRQEYYQEVLAVITKTYLTKKGNYIAYFPSYEYLQQIKPFFEDSPLNKDCIFQDKELNDLQREQLIQTFSKQNEKILITVLGGIYSEGIDLPGEKIIGAFIIGVGLPKLTAEGDQLKNYHQEKYHKGFEYAYLLPGINKVNQSAGRVIRSETDKGTVILMDERFTNYQYRKHLPNHWKNTTIDNLHDLEITLKEFWQPISRN